MNPSIGRIVHYWFSGASTPVPAVITKVWSDTCVNLGVFGSGYSEVTSVARGEIDASGAQPSSRFWDWPPKV